MNSIQKLYQNPSIKFVVQFLFFFAALYGFTYLIIGLSAPGGLYSGFVAKHLDYVSGLQGLLQQSTTFIMALVDIPITNAADYRMILPNGKSLIISISCVGYGVYSVWLGYILASDSNGKVKLFAGIIGLLILFLINVSRISLFAYALQTGKEMPFGLDHHTYFNILAYIAIGLMIVMYNRFFNRIRTTTDYGQ